MVARLEGWEADACDCKACAQPDIYKIVGDQILAMRDAPAEPRALGKVPELAMPYTPRVPGCDWLGFGSVAP